MNLFVVQICSAKAVLRALSIEKKCSEPRLHGEGQALATGCGRLLMSDEGQVSLTLRLERLLPTYRVNIRRGELLVRNAHPYQQISDNNIC